MPFTLAHPLAIVPVAALDRRRTLPLAALAIGTMIPDLPFFFGITSESSVTHSIPGLFAACLPLGLVALALYHGLLKRPLLALLPGPVRRRCGALLKPLGPISPEFVLATCVAILIGAATHILWDAFTHGGRLGAWLFPWLHDIAFVIRRRRAVPWFEVFQLVSSALGVALLGVVCLAWLARQPVLPPDEAPPGLPPIGLAIAYGLMFAIPTSICAGLVAYHGRVHSRGISLAVTWSGLLLMFGLLAYALAYTLLTSTARTPRGQLDAE
jgi:hypothetical protein